MFSRNFNLFVFFELNSWRFKKIFCVETEASNLIKLGTEFFMKIVCRSKDKELITNFCKELKKSFANHIPVNFHEISMRFTPLSVMHLVHSDVDEHQHPTRQHVDSVIVWMSIGWRQRHFRGTVDSSVVHFTRIWTLHYNHWRFQFS